MILVTLDLGSLGPINGLANIRERIDRAIANVPWRIAYLNATVHHYKITPSDHTPIILRFLGYEPSMPKYFKFESFWVREKASFAVVAKSWAVNFVGTPVWVVFKKIWATRYALRKWNKEFFGNIQYSIHRTTNQINYFQQAVLTPYNLEMEKNLIGVLEELLQREEELWKQKFRLRRLTTSDLNTKFYHASTVIRRCWNQVSSLKFEDKGWISRRKEVGSEFLQFFQLLSSSDNSKFPADLEHLMEPMIITEENERLIQILEEDEITQILSLMHPNKAPGPDGMTVLFSNIIGKLWVEMLFVW